LTRWRHEHPSIDRRHDLPQFQQRPDLHEQSGGVEYLYKLQLIGFGMKYVKAHKQTLTARLLQQLSVISTAPAMTYSLEPEHLGVPSLEASALSITVLSPSRAYMLSAREI